MSTPPISNRGPRAACLELREINACESEARVSSSLAHLFTELSSWDATLREQPVVMLMCVGLCYIGIFHIEMVSCTKRPMVCQAVTVMCCSITPPPSKLSFVSCACSSLFSIRVLQCQVGCYGRCFWVI